MIYSAIADPPDGIVLRDSAAGAWLFRVDRGTTRQGGDAAEPLVRRNKDGDMLQAVEIENNGQLQCIKRPQALNRSVLNQVVSWRFESGLHEPAAQQSGVGAQDRPGSGTGQSAVQFVAATITWPPRPHYPSVSSRPFYVSSPSELGPLDGLSVPTGVFAPLK